MKITTKSPIIILHGWGREVCGKKYNEIKNLLEKNGFEVFAPDLPGFGDSVLNKNALEFEDYLSFVNDFILKQKLKDVILIGHSFGGRIAIKFAAKYPQKVKSLILIAASGIQRPLPSLKKKAVFVATKILRPFFYIPPLSLFFKFFRKLVYFSIGEMDYYKAGKLAETFKNIYQVSVLDDLPKIKAPTLLVWGENDKVVPVDDGKTMEQLIPNSKLIVIKNEGHKIPYENPKVLNKVITEFI